MSPAPNALDETEIRQLLESWSSETRKGDKNRVLKNHLPDVLIYDVLSPLKYEGADAYRRSWDEWQPDTQGEGKFDLEDLSVTTGSDVAFAHCFIRCDGTLPDGRTFEDLVRATFCLRKIDDHWKIAHQHISKPVQLGGS
ncbi:MAG: nuclear transport factor 2 family protein [Acidobacteriia bacterium]|nr:nuclear transport factor 2 family protein [Terriglobia bacterium]